METEVVYFTGEAVLVTEQVRGGGGLHGRGGSRDRAGEGGGLHGRGGARDGAGEGGGGVVSG